MNYLSSLIALTLASAPATPDLADKGLRIAQKVDAADSGWGDEQVSAEMVLRAADGREVKRVIRTRSLEMPGQGDRTMVVFDLPSDVRGTAFLTHAHKSGNDDQWLFLPALKRVKRISSSNRSGPFMGSEFAYEDISSEEPERYTYHYVEEKSCAKLTCHVYERTPIDENSGYSKQIVYTDTQYYRVHKIEFFDRKGAHQKTLTRSGYEAFGEFWRAAQWTMINHLSGKSTAIVWRDRRFGAGFEPGDFEKNAMKRFK